MRVFPFSELVEYVKTNQTRYFDYLNCRSSDACGCLLVSFFKAKGIRVFYANVKGEAKDVRNFTLAKVDLPFNSVGEIHCVGDDHIVSGRQIFEKITQLNLA
jgi:hypothetical protein